MAKPCMSSPDATDELVKVGDSIDASNASWTFGGAIPEAFDEHVRRSVPMYSEGHDLVVSLSDFSCAKDRPAMSSDARPVL